MAKKRFIGGGGHDLFRKGISHKRIPQRMPFAVPISFFKSISMIFGGAGLIFEGLTNRGGCGNETFCEGFPGVNPQRSNQSVLWRNLFWEMLFQKQTGTAFRSSPLASGLEGVTHEGRKMATAGARAFRRQRRAAPTLLNDAKSFNGG